MKRTPESEATFIELRAKGLSFEKIAKEIGVSKQTLLNWSKELRFEIQNMKVIEMDALKERLMIQREHRLKEVTKIRDRISQELDKRSFEDVPTDKLVELARKLNVHIEALAPDEMKFQVLPIIDMVLKEEVTSWTA